MTVLLSESAHDSMIELLPWYVNGTLQDDEQRSIEQHLGTCASCRDDVEALSRVSRAMRNESPAPLIPPLRTDRLLDSLDEPQHRYFGVPNWMSYAAASIVLILSATWLFMHTGETPDRSSTIFETATSNDIAEPVGYVVEITFAADTGAIGRDSTLAAINGIGSASRVGESRYRITLNSASASLADLEKQINAIESRPEIVSARVVAVQLPIE